MTLAQSLAQPATQTEPTPAQFLKRKGGATLPRIPSLDGLRALAVISVVIGHSFATVPGVDASAIGHAVGIVLRTVVPYAIDLFFVISGYLITAILYETRSANRPLRTFYFRRALRIVPLYYAYLVFCQVLLFKAGAAGLGSGGPLLELLFLTNIGMMRGVPAVGFLHAHFWTLAIEEQFYFLWPLIVLLVSSRRLTWICITLITGSFLGRTALTLAGQGHIGWLLSFTRLDGLIAGGLVAIAQRRNPEILSLVSRRLFVVSGTIALPLLLAAVGWGSWHIKGGLLETFQLSHKARLIEIALVPMVGAVFFASATALLVMKNTGNEPILTSGPLLKVAEASYGMYIFHIPILVILQGLKFTEVLANFGLLNRIVLSGVALFLSYHFGRFTFNHFEKRFIRMAPRYTYPVPA